MRRGEGLLTVAVAALSVIIRHEGREQMFALGSFSRGHEAHPRLRAGDTVIVVSDTKPNGHTEVAIPDCGCRAVVWQQ